jgi:chemotaxis signal transduction protein
MNLLLFQVSEYIFAFEINDIERIVEKKQVISPVPIVPVFIKGITNFQGRIITVVDIASLFNISEKRESSFLLIPKKFNNVGFLVKSTIGFKAVDDILFQKLENCEIFCEYGKFNCKIINGLIDRPVSFLYLDELGNFITNPENWSEINETKSINL